MKARRLLEETPLPLKDITARTGFGDASTMWRAFTQRLGVTPAAYRQRFAAASTGNRDGPALNLTHTRTRAPFNA